MTDRRRVHPDEWATLRDVRLAALRDAPYAFNSTVEEASAFDEGWWRDRAATQACVVAFDGAAPIGLAMGGHLREPDPEVRTLRSMWVAPDHRGAGVADGLVDDVVAWARAEGASRLVLWALLPAARAQAFYERYGFTRGAVEAPTEHHPAMVRYELAL
ncbi:MAG TPA: GNAT family N-acetyltransferase [Acidimicrobiales bacterium]|nr:GNAT family N-acetyltransferase [Acidimicrobiales bacterium]